MLNIKVVMWNVEDFGSHGAAAQLRYGLPRTELIARALVKVDADIVLLQEWKGNTPVGLNVRNSLLATLNIANNQHHWYCSSLPGALTVDGGNNLQIDNLGYSQASRNEGYLLFWRQNIAKFIMQSADPIDRWALAGMADNQAQFGVNIQSHLTIGPNGLAHSVVPNVQPGQGNYSLPAGSTIANPGITSGPANQIRVPMGVTQNNIPLLSGDLIPRETQIGAGGVQINGGQIVIPGGFTLTQDLILPGFGHTLVPQHILGLVLNGRPIQGDGVIRPFLDEGQIVQILAANPQLNAQQYRISQWPFLRFPRGSNVLTNIARRPATCTIKINIGNVQNPDLGDVLIPITVYHAPASNAASHNGTVRASLSRSLYQAFDHTNNRYVDCVRAIIGGDFNRHLNHTAREFIAYTAPFDHHGANCQIRLNNNPPVPNVHGHAVNNNDPRNKTSIKLNHALVNGLPILSNIPDDFKGPSIDNIFYRGFQNHEAPPHQFRYVSQVGINHPQAELFETHIYDITYAISRNAERIILSLNGNHPTPISWHLLPGIPHQPFQENFFLERQFIAPFRQQLLVLTNQFAQAVAQLLADLQQFGGAHFHQLVMVLNQIIAQGNVANEPQLNRISNLLNLGLNNARQNMNVPLEDLFEEAIDQFNGILTSRILDLHRFNTHLMNEFQWRNPIALYPGNYFGPLANPNPRYSVERGAAEFVRIFVSDHLPVIFTMNI